MLVDNCGGLDTVDVDVENWVEERGSGDGSCQCSRQWKVRTMQYLGVSPLVRNSHNPWILLNPSPLTQLSLTITNFQLQVCQTLTKLTFLKLRQSVNGGLCLFKAFTPDEFMTPLCLLYLQQSAPGLQKLTTFDLAHCIFSSECIFLHLSQPYWFLSQWCFWGWAGWLVLGLKTFLGQLGHKGTFTF